MRLQGIALARFVPLGPIAVRSATSKQMEGEYMSRRILGHLRSHVVAYVALFFALTGSAAALTGQNTVFSDDITNGQVKSADIGTDEVKSPDIFNNGVKTADIADGHVRSPDIAADAVDSSEIATNAVKGDEIDANAVDSSEIAANAVGSSEIAANSVDGGKVADNSLDGADINEGTLSGLGASDGFDGLCDPQSPTFIDCDAQATVSLNRTMNVLVIVTTHFDVAANAPAWGNCRLERNDAVSSNNHPIGGFTQDTSTSVHQGGMNLVDVQTLSAGTYTFEVSCNQEDSDVEYRDIRVAAVELSQ